MRGSGGVGKRVRLPPHASSRDTRLARAKCATLKLPLSLSHTTSTQHEQTALRRIPSPSGLEAATNKPHHAITFFLASARQTRLAVHEQLRQTHRLDQVLVGRGRLGVETARRRAFRSNQPAVLQSYAAEVAVKAAKQDAGAIATRSPDAHSRTVKQHKTADSVEILCAKYCPCRPFKEHITRRYILAESGSAAPKLHGREGGRQPRAQITTRASGCEQRRFQRRRSGSARGVSASRSLR